MSRSRACLNLFCIRSGPFQAYTPKSLPDFMASFNVVPGRKRIVHQSNKRPSEQQYIGKSIPIWS